MNEAIKNIKARRSIRKYTDAEVTNKQIRIILDCAMAAPTARNQQAFRFIVVDDKNILNEISRNIEHAKMCKGANKAIVVCSEVVNEMQESYWVQDASAATQNILLSATALGIGSVWVAVHPRAQKIEYITKLFTLPAQIKPLCLVALGVADEVKPPNERYDAQKVRYNKW